jgi:hypothetical protein
VKYALPILAMVIFFKPVLPFLDYAFNYDYIAKVLCINKDKPKLKCNGKCYLMQQLAKNAEEDSSKENLPKKVEFQLLFFQDSRLLEFEVLTQPINKQSSTLWVSQSYKKRYIDALFRPPIFA